MASVVGGDGKREQIATPMAVKGTAFLARRVLIEKDLSDAHGPEKARALFDAAVAQVPTLPRPILASTPIPMGAYLEFQDLLVKMYYRSAPEAFTRFGEKSAEWSLTEGPYKRLMLDKDVITFAGSGEVLFRTFYDAGRALTRVEADHVSYRIDGIAPAYRHPFVELAPLGFFRRALEMLGATKLHPERVAGFSAGDDHVHYRLRFEGSLDKNTR